MVEKAGFAKLEYRKGNLRGNIKITDDKSRTAAWKAYIGHEEDGTLLLRTLGTLHKSGSDFMLTVDEKSNNIKDNKVVLLGRSGEYCSERCLESLYIQTDEPEDEAKIARETVTEQQPDFEMIPEMQENIPSESPEIDMIPVYQTEPQRTRGIYAKQEMTENLDAAAMELVMASEPRSKNMPQANYKTQKYYGAKGEPLQKGESGNSRTVEPTKKKGQKPWQQANPYKTEEQISHQKTESNSKEGQIPHQTAEPINKEGQISRQTAEPINKEGQISRQVAEPINKEGQIPHPQAESVKTEVHQPYPQAKPAKTEMYQSHQQTKPVKTEVSQSHQQTKPVKTGGVPSHPQTEPMKKEIPQPHQQTEPMKKEASQPHPQTEPMKKEIPQPHPQAEPMKKEASQPHQQAEPMKKEIQQLHQRGESVKKEENKSVYQVESKQEMKEQSKENAEQKAVSESLSEQIETDDWINYIIKVSVGMYPFHDDELNHCIRIEPKDFGLLPSQHWALGSNSFLLNGYYSYRHVLLGVKEENGKRNCYLGVPGVYHRREIFMAKMFGFSLFKGVQDKKTVAIGDFGYWMMLLS